MVTMLLGGLWHGASWTFVIWGGMHGLYLGVERALKGVVGEAAWLRRESVQVLLGIFTFLLVTLTWIFFRAQIPPVAIGMFKAALFIEPQGMMVLSTLEIVKVCVVMSGILVSHWFLRNESIEQIVSRVPWWLGGIVWAGMVIITMVAQGGGSAFIYFQF
jgi:alginate O-acetyltransferase complex protein AlgI